MIKKLQVIHSQDYNPYFNLALEEYLVGQVAADVAILYLWQNENTVVIGRNQNAWKECKVNALEDDQGHLARRLSGGGAVYHDLGNLNFTFVMSNENYDVERQSGVILKALSYDGVIGERSGRNDLLINGKKFSGNAYYHNERNAYHHGTLLVDVDISKMGMYLNVSQDKLKGNGVESVRSRVMNLKELIPNITIDHLKKNMVRAFGETYGLPVEPMILNPSATSQILQMTQRYESKQWKFNRHIKTNYELIQRFGWGEFHFVAQLKEDLIQDCSVYSDAMDVFMIQRIEESLREQKFHKNILIPILEDLKQQSNASMINDIQQLLIENME